MPFAYQPAKARLPFRLIFTITVCLQLNPLIGFADELENARDKAATITAIDLMSSDKDRDHAGDVATLVVLREMLEYRKIADDEGIPVLQETYSEFGAEVGNYILEYDPEIRSLTQRGRAAVFDAMADALATGVGKFEKTGLAAGAIKGVYKAGRELTLVDLELQNRSIYRNEMWAIGREATSQVPDIIGEVFDACRSTSASDTEFCVAAQAFVEGQFGIRIGDSAEKIEAAVPGGFQEFPRDENGQLSLNPDDLNKVISGLGERYTKDIVNRLVPELKKQFEKGVVAEGKKPDLVAEEIKTLNDNHQKLVKFFSSTFKLASLLMEATDSEHGKRMLTAATAQFQIWEAFNSFAIKAKALAGSADNFAKLTNIFDTTTAVTTGVMTLMSLVKKHKKSGSDQALMRELSLIRQMIQTLRTEMHDRFDRVDKALNEIMITLVESFFKIDLSLGVIQGDLGQIQGSILGLHTQLNRLTRYILEWDQSASKDSFLDSVDDCLSYKERTGKEMTLEKFDECERALFGWAARNSTDSLWSGPLNRNYQDDTIADAMNDFPLSVNINYFSQFPRRNLQLDELNPGTLPNPIEWQIGAQTYIDLITDWPDLARQVPGLEDRRLAILSLGLELRDSLRRIVSSQDNAGKNNPSFEIFKGIFEKYRALLNAMGQQIKNLEQTYVAQKMKISGTNEFLDPWKSADDQRTAWQPTLPTITTPKNTQLAMPDGNITQFLAPIYFMAGRLGWGGLTVFINNVAWQNERTPVVLPFVVEAESMQGNGVSPGSSTATISDNQTLKKTVNFEESGYYKIYIYGGPTTTNQFGPSISIEIDDEGYGTAYLETISREAFAGGGFIEKGSRLIELRAHFSRQFGTVPIDRIEFRQVHGPSSCVLSGSDTYNPAKCELRIVSEAVDYHPRNQPIFTDLLTAPVLADLVFDVEFRYEGHPVLNLRGKIPAVKSITSMTLQTNNYAPASDSSFDSMDVLTKNWSAESACFKFGTPLNPIFGRSQLQHCIASANIKSTFKNTMTMQFTPSEAAAHKGISDRLNANLQANRAEIFQIIRDKFNVSDGLQKGAELLDGIRSLIEGYTVLGLPYTVSERELVRALLYGSEKVMGTNQFIEFYLNAKTDVATRPDPLVVANDRLNLLEDVLKKEVDFYGSQEAVEVLPGVADTIRDLQGVVAMLSNVPLPPGTGVNNSNDKFRLKRVRGARKFAKGNKDPFNVTAKLEFIGSSSEVFANRKQLKSAVGFIAKTKKGCSLHAKVQSVKGKFPKSLEPNQSVSVEYSVAPGKCSGKVPTVPGKNTKVAVLYGLTD